MIQIIITAGGTTESIDGVRKITNNSTGRLSACIYEALADRAGAGGAERQTEPPPRFAVHYVVTDTAIRPEEKPGLPIHFHPVTDVKSTEQILKKLMTELRIGYVVHGMAVSDFTKGYLIEREQLAGELAAALQEAIRRENGSLQPEEMERIIGRVLEQPARAMDLSRKISSKSELMLSLEQTPKLIGFFKQWDPDVFLVGFKLLRDVPEAELIRAGEELAEKNGCDLVLLNDQAQISGSRHMGLLLQNGSVIGRYETKHEIAAAIAAAIVQDAREKQKKVIGGGV